MALSSRAAELALSYLRSGFFCTMMMLRKLGTIAQTKLHMYATFLRTANLPHRPPALLHDHSHELRPQHPVLRQWKGAGSWRHTLTAH